jgi:solute carrier family 6 (neurotransmitter transporter, glycine) member 5/9
LNTRLIGEREIYVQHHNEYYITALSICSDAFIVTTLDTFTSLLGGTTIFAILGNLAYNLKIDNIDEVVAGGSTLAFISYPDAIAKFSFVPQVCEIFLKIAGFNLFTEFKQLFAVLFFFMLFTLGLGSGVALHNAVVSAIWDAFPHIKYWKILLGQTTFTFLVGLMYVTPGGQWMLTLVDFFGGTFSVFGLAIVELVAIFWIYGKFTYYRGRESKKKVTLLIMDRMFHFNTITSQLNLLRS